jgi:hypothetical protein
VRARFDRRLYVLTECVKLLQLGDIILLLIVRNFCHVQRTIIELLDCVLAHAERVTDPRKRPPSQHPEGNNDSTDGIRKICAIDWSHFGDNCLCRSRVTTQSNLVASLFTHLKVQMVGWCQGSGINARCPGGTTTLRLEYVHTRSVRLDRDQINQGKTFSAHPKCYLAHPYICHGLESLLPLHVVVPHL